MTIHADLLAALIFLIFGAIAVFMGWGYGFGTFSSLGSGAMPVLVGAGLMLMGMAQLAQTAAARRAGARFASAFPASEGRPLILILLSVLAFGLLVDRVGVLPALAALVGISWMADRGGRRRELIAVLAIVAILIVGIFYFGLGIPLRLVTWRL